MEMMNLNTEPSKSAMALTHPKHPAPPPPRVSLAGRPTIAFCFLTLSDVHHADMWRDWFAEAPEPDMYAIFVHRTDAEPGNALESKGATLIEAQQPSREPKHGGFDIVRVHYALTKAAMAHSPIVTKIVFLSADCVPVQRFSAVYAALTASPARGVLAWDTPNAGHALRDGPALAARRADYWPRELSWTWLVASQWSVLARHHAAALVEHWVHVESTFEVPGTAGEPPTAACKVPDEHALVVLFAALGLLDSFDRRPFMYVDWEGKEADNSCGIEEKRKYTHAPSSDGNSPHTFHAHEGGDFEQGLRCALACGALFMRKVCELGAFGRPWTWSH